MIKRRAHDASADEQLAGRRASQKYSSKAAGTMAAAGEAAAAAADCMLERRGEADIWWRNARLQDAVHGHFLL